jgi:hypothetical protein
MLLDKSEKPSPVPKSPGTHMKSPKSNMIKVKTSYKLKVSAEKIYSTNYLVKEEKSRRKREDNLDYFMDCGKDRKKIKKTVDGGANMPSPRAGTSRSTSRR